MQRGKAFVVVGHAHWGKSRTIRSLTGSIRRRRININGIDIYIKRMSNDDIPKNDIPKHLIDFLRNIDNNEFPVIIISLCPNFDDTSKKTVEIIELLQTKYEIFFWVLKKKYGRKYGARDDEVRDAEIQRLGDFGEVGIFPDRAEAEIRAAAFRDFIETNL